MQYHVNPTNQTQEKGFLRILTNVNTRNNDENIFSTTFVRAAVRHNRNELEYAKSAKSNEANSRNWTKTPFWARFGHVWPDLGPGHFFFKNPTSSLF